MPRFLSCNHTSFFIFPYTILCSALCFCCSIRSARGGSTTSEICICPREQGAKLFWGERLEQQTSTGTGEFVNSNLVYGKRHPPTRQWNLYVGGSLSPENETNDPVEAYGNLKVHKSSRGVLNFGLNLFFEVICASFSFSWWRQWNNGCSMRTMRRSCHRRKCRAPTKPNG